MRIWDAVKIYFSIHQKIANLRAELIEAEVRVEDAREDALFLIEKAQSISEKYRDAEDKVSISCEMATDVAARVRQLEQELCSSTQKRFDRMAAIVKQQDQQWHLVLDKLEEENRTLHKRLSFSMRDQDSYLAH
jgi:cobalamin biosynthesis protein CbiD